MDICSYRKTLPILHEADLLIVGGSFAGVGAALTAAQNGLKVVIVESRTYLGREVTATLRPWFELGEGQTTESLPALIRTSIEAAGMEEGSSFVGGNIPERIIPLRIADVKKHLEDLLIQAGVKFVYASHLVGLLHQNGVIEGGVIGNKSGRQVIKAATVVDATETCISARILGQVNEPGEETFARYRRTLEFDRVKAIGDRAVEDRTIAVPESLGIDGNTLRLIPGAQGPEHWFVECPLLLNGSMMNAIDWSDREVEAREKTMAVAAHLMKNHPAFQQAYLATTSYLLDGPLTLTVKLHEQDWFQPANPTRIEGTQLGLADTAGSISGLFMLNDSIARTAEDRDALRNPIQAARLGEAFGAVVPEPAARAAAQATEPKEARAPVEANGKMQIKEQAQPQQGRQYGQSPVPPTCIPVLRTTDVVVVGGGTSGATAAAISSRHGAKTVLVELNTGLGGTGTIGGVHLYWFGRRVGYSQELIEAVEAMHAGLGMDPPEGSLKKWNIEAKMFTLLRRLEFPGTSLLWGSIVTGTVMEDDRVHGVALATPFGPAALMGEVIIDATGDGDVAAYAGAEFIYGSKRDHITMWYSLAQFYRPGVTRNNFTSMVDVSNIEDYTRAILAGRRRAEGHDAGTYIAPRESRHILADVVLTLNDQLLKRCWPDTISIAFSNHDVKGHTTSDWVRAGLIPPNLEIEIPYRVMLPKGLEGILVTGKAISATHDAQPAVRMQPDMENLGGVAGLAAALAVKTHCTPRQVDVPRLQEMLVKENVLPAGILNRSRKQRKYNPQTLRSLLDQIDPEKPLWKYQDMELDVVYEGNIPIVELCCAGPEVVPFLDQELKSATGPRRLLISRCLAFVGAKTGVPELIRAIHAETPDEGLQYRSARIRHVNLPPDQGAMPDVVYLLYTLGMARDQQALPVWDHFAELVSQAEEEDIRDRNLGLFYYVDSICYGAERLSDPRAVPLLKKMHSNPLFKDRVSRGGFEPDFFFERQAYLDLVISRTLARCGDASGLETLIEYLQDARALLAEHAHSELKAITDQDFGKDQQAWRNWLAKNIRNLHPVPVEDANEAVQPWGEEIEVCE